MIKIVLYRIYELIVEETFSNRKEAEMELINLEVIRPNTKFILREEKEV